MKTENLRIVFMGTPGFAVGVLSTLVSNNYNVVGVVTAPDRPKGRGRSLQGSEVKQFALQHNINVLQPTNLKDASFLQELKNLAPTLQIVVAFRMLPKVVWQIPSLGTFNLHASLLPQYRGAAPINWAIINKEQTTGVTTFFIDEKIDTGEIILSQKVTIAEDETVGSLHDVLMDIGSQLVIETIEIIKKGDLSTTPQPLEEDFSSLQLQEAPKLTPNNTYIDWCATPETIDHFVRGLNPYPCAWSFLEQEGEKIKVKIYKVALIKPEHENSLWFITKDAGIKISEHSQLGAVKEIHKKLYVQLHNQVLEIIEIQLPGKRKMLTKDLVNGYDFMPDAKMIVNPHG
ncbi:methionyl-tRNA formyltransferase [Flavobacteriaceae bacterium]|nr:methionyl-tRNA formyltransferase [Flavobacteriaceae bacterium]